MATDSELIALIQSTPELKLLADSGNDAALATALSAVLPVVPKVDTFLSERGIFNLLGAVEGEAFLQTVEALAESESELQKVFVRAVRWLRDPIGLDVGNLETQLILQQLIPPFNPVSVAKIIAFGSQKQTFTIEEVSQLR